MSDNLELDRVTRKAKEPAKGWRNKWRSLIDWESNTGREYTGGKVHFSQSVYPSKEIAEQKAGDWLAQWSSGFSIYPEPTCEYLGAFPVPTT